MKSLNGNEKVQEYVKELIMQGTNRWDVWVKENPEKTTKILKVFYDDLIDFTLL